MDTTKQMLQVPFVDLTAQHAPIQAEIEAAIAKVMKEAHFILGRDVTMFEEEFAAFCEVKYAIGMDSGTSALELALRAFDIGAGDEVITTANTFIATVLAISSTNATPVLVDVDPQTYTIDIAGLEKAITPRTRAIIPVHLYGQPAEMDGVLDIARRHNLVVIEDACQAHGARYKGKRVGSLGHAAAFSFYPAKNLGGCGNGGMLVTNDPTVAKAAQMLRDYGQVEKYHHVLRGYNHRLDTLQAAILRVKLKHLEVWNNARRQHAQLYNELLGQTPIVLPMGTAYTEPVYHLYVIRLKNRDQLKSYLHDRGIATGIHYPIPIHLQPAYRDLGYKPGDFPVTENYATQNLSLPMYPELPSEFIEYVTDAIKDFVLMNYIYLLDRQAEDKVDDFPGYNPLR